MLFAGRAALGTEHRNVFRAVGGKTNPYRTRAVEPQLKSRTLSSCFAHIFHNSYCWLLTFRPSQTKIPSGRRGFGMRFYFCLLRITKPLLSKKGNDDDSE